MLNRRQTITWTNADPVHWHICGTRGRWVNSKTVDALAKHWAINSHHPIFNADTYLLWEYRIQNTESLLSTLIVTDHQCYRAIKSLKTTVHSNTIDTYNTRPRIINVTATRRKNLSQWERSFLWKLRCHWPKFPRRAIYGLDCGMLTNLSSSKPILFFINKIPLTTAPIG